jgi:hypothetical protein
VIVGGAGGSGAGSSAIYGAGGACGNGAGSSAIYGAGEALP